MLEPQKSETGSYPWRSPYPESIYSGYMPDATPWDSAAELSDWRTDSIDKDSIWAHETVVETAPTTKADPHGDEERALPAKPEAPAGPPLPFDPRQFPDGGLSAWLCVLGGFCCMYGRLPRVTVRDHALTCSQVRLIRMDKLWVFRETVFDGHQLNNPFIGIGVFQEHYQSHQLRHLPPSTISWIPSLEVFLMFLGVSNTWLRAEDDAFTSTRVLWWASYTITTAHAGSCSPAPSSTYLDS